MNKKNHGKEQIEIKKRTNLTAYPFSLSSIVC